MPDSRLKLMRCVECGKSFSVESVAGFQFFPDSMTCFDCLQTLQEKPAVESCFGKENKPRLKIFGYSEQAEECTRLCPDRKQCKLFVSGRIHVLRKLTAEGRKEALKALREGQRQQALDRRQRGAHPFKKGSINRSVFDKCLKGIKLIKLKEFCEVVGVEFKPMYLKMSKGFGNGHTWKWSEDNNGKCKIDWKVPVSRLR